MLKFPGANLSRLSSDIEILKFHWLFNPGKPNNERDILNNFITVDGWYRGKGNFWSHP